MLASPDSRHWRSYLRLSMRGLIVLVLVTGAGLGWLVRERSDSARSRHGDRTCGWLGWI